MFKGYSKNKKNRRYDVRRMEQLYKAITRGPAQVVRQQPVIIPSSGSAPVIVTSGGGGGVPQKAKPQIVIKQTVKQIQNSDDKQRKKQVKRARTDARKKRLKEYNALKAKAKKQITAGKKAHYTRENTRIKAMPVKQRVAARKKVRDDLKKKQQALLKQMPAGGRLSMQDLVALISKVKKIKW